jgi:diguanylate cyclase (GGDEF)-like protein
VLAGLKRWWRRPDHYDWLSGYLHARGMSRTTRVMLATIVASFTVSLLVLMLSEGGPRGTIAPLLTWLAAAAGLLAAALWVWRWPTRRQSVLFAATTSTSIALACVAYPNPLAALLGCTAFATVGAYLAFFHTSRLVLCNFTLAATVAAREAVAVASAGHVGLAVVDLWLILQINIATPFAIRWLVSTLGVDLLQADRDPLTGLLNRRAFLHQTLGLITARRSTDMHLTVLLIDLDSFKALNDSRGHTAGDQALAQVAQALRDNVRDTAVIARAGGEEFIIADTWTGADSRVLSQRLCRAIAALPAGVTASIGAATITLDGIDGADYQSLIDHLVASADDAMYRAKRNGGNQCHHQDQCPTVTVDDET